VHLGTCDWFFETEEFCDWRDRADLPANNGVLWLKGKPGAGKSTLMKHVFNHCKDNFSEQLLLAYFFNARGDVLEKTYMGMLRSIVFQLTKQDEVVRKRFVQRCREKAMIHEGSELEWQPSDLRDLLVIELGQRSTRPVILLIDALDECSESDAHLVVKFLQDLSAKATRSGATVRVCLSSRHYLSIDMNRKLELILESSEKHREDIMSYISENLYSKDEELYDEIEKKSDGVFLWAVLVVALLNEPLKAGRIEQMKEILDSLPGDLEDVFDAMLHKDERHKAETVLILQWVLFSPRPLTPEELFFGVTIEVAPQLQGPWDRSQITSQVIERRIRDSSKGLIEIREGGDGPEAQFIHRSVNDFLHRNRRLCRLDPELGKDPIRASHKRLWSCCWKYLEQFDMTQTSERALENTENEYPFLNYALGSVLAFANKALPTAAKKGKRHTAPSWLSYFHGRPRQTTSTDDDVSRWLQGYTQWYPSWQRAVMRFSIRDDITVEAGVKLLYIVARNEWQSLARSLLNKKDVDVNAQGGRYGNALQAASWQGSQEVVQLLLDEGADVNAQGGEYGTALQAALWRESHQAGSRRGSQEVVRLLLDAGADVNAKGGEYGNPLQAASINGRQEVVQLLLDKRAEVNAQGGYYGNALQAASYGGSLEVVRLLLDKGADVNAQSGRYGNALQAASYQGTKEVVQLLLDKRAEVNAQGGYYGNALQAASWRGSKEVVRLLLDKGADVNAQGGKYGNALQAASAEGEQEVVQLLLDKGAHVNAQGGKYGNALQAASAEGEQEVVQLLLDKGAQLNPKTST
jgi:ankyrin repeat protein